MAGMTRPDIPCAGCGRIHQLSPAAMAVVILAYQAGDMQSVGLFEGQPLTTPKCILSALSMAEHRTPYADRKIEAVTVGRADDTACPETEAIDI